MSECKRGIEHEHEHIHSDNCGHKKIMHDNHFGYLHDGSLHCQHDGHIDEHKLEHPSKCTNGHSCSGHDQSHKHGDSCGHPRVPHGDHVCYLVDGHLHSSHNGHCDHHGELKVVCETHQNHGSHQHQAGCGHLQVIHDGHVGYLHHGHLHCPHEGHVDEHILSVNDSNPSGCVSKDESCHKSSHFHGNDCGHPMIPHGDHFDFIVNGQLHHSHNGHCDHHGLVEVVYPKHERHSHQHGEGCGHVKIQHDGHVDYLHDGHLHHQKSQSVCEDHSIAESKNNKSECTPSHSCNSHNNTHTHGVGCGHEMIAHADHFDFIVDGHLHHPHGSHCDHHGSVHIVA